MQAAVLAGLLVGVNKVSKFDKAVAANWETDVLFNPSFAALQTGPVFTFAGVQLTIDPQTAIIGEE
jgi:hypothetical protein